MGKPRNERKEKNQGHLTRAKPDLGNRKGGMWNTRGNTLGRWGVRDENLRNAAKVALAQ